VAEGIEFVRQALVEWHFGAAALGGDEERAEDAVLVAAELLANAQQHGGGPRSIDLTYQEGRLDIGVSDASCLPPHRALPHRANRIGGHGLHIVDHLSNAWRTVPDPIGKTVWATLRLNRAARRRWPRS
jgi:hypothetical protein